MTTMLVAYLFIVGLHAFPVGSTEYWEPPNDTVSQELPDLIKQIAYIDPHLQSTITPELQFSIQDKLGIVICLCTELPGDMSSYFFAATSDPSSTPLHLYRMGYFHRFKTCEADLKEFAKNLALNEATTYEKVLSSRPMSTPLVDLKSCLSLDSYSWSSVLLHSEMELLVEEKRRLQNDELYVIYNIDGGYQAVLVSPSAVCSGLLFVKFKGKLEKVLEDARNRLGEYLISEEYIVSWNLPLRPRWEIPSNIFLNQRDTIGGWLSSLGEVMNGWTFKHVLKLRIVTTKDNSYQILLLLRRESKNARMIGIIVPNDRPPWVTYNQNIKDNDDKYEDSLLNDYGQLAFSDIFTGEYWQFDKSDCTHNYRIQIAEHAPFPPLPSDKRIMFQNLHTTVTRQYPNYYVRICSCEENIFLIIHISKPDPCIKFISPLGTAEDVARCYENFNHSVEDLFGLTYIQGLSELQGISPCIKEIQEKIHRALSAQHETFKNHSPVIVNSFKNETSQPAWIEGPIYLAFPPFSETRMTGTDYWYCMVIKVPLKTSSVDVTAEGVTSPENVMETTVKTLDSGEFLFVTVSTKRVTGDDDDCQSPASFEYLSTSIRSSGYTSLETAKGGMFSFVKNAHKNGNAFAE